MSSVPFAKNKYFVHISPDIEPTPWNIYDPNPGFEIGLATYIWKVFLEMEKSLKVSGLTFYITWFELNELPSYGPDVVVVILGDEWFCTPKYAHKVGAIFKCMGYRPFLNCNPFLHPSRLNLMTFAQYLRMTLVRFPGKINCIWQKINKIFDGKSGNIAPIYELPVGYYNSVEQDIKPLEKRIYDTYFSGSINHIKYPLWSYKYWIGTPKMLSRKEMVSRLQKIKETHPEFKIELLVTQDYSQSTKQQSRSYPETIMDTKICIAPRGSGVSGLETPRIFEGMKYGCIVITETLASRWYLEGAPIIQIKNWKELDAVLEKLLSNPELMEELHQESLNWWKNKCSEAAVGAYIAGSLNALRRTTLIQPEYCAFAA